jgi:hypothetical protein
VVQATPVTELVVLEPKPLQVKPAGEIKDKTISSAKNVGKMMTLDRFFAPKK